MTTRADIITHVLTTRRQLDSILRSWDSPAPPAQVRLILEQVADARDALNRALAVLAHADSHLGLEEVECKVCGKATPRRELRFFPIGNVMGCRECRGERLEAV